MAATVLRGAYGLPSSRMAPSSGSYKPQSSFTSVDLPAPFWPARTCTSPRRIARSTRSNASTPGNRFVVPWNSMMSGGAALPRSTKWLSGGGGGGGPPPGGALHQIGRGDQLDGSLEPALQVLSLLHAEAGLDAVRGHLRPELVDGGEHLPVLHQFLDGGDVVESDHLDLARLPRGVERLHHAERHRVVRGHDALHVRMRGQEIGRASCRERV